MESTEMIKKFKQTHPSLGKEIHVFKKVNQAYVLIFFRDETVILYAAYEDTYHHVKLFESIRDISEGEYRKGIGNLIKARMMSLGLNQTEIVKQCKVNRDTLSRYIMGKTTPSIYTLAEIANVLECRVDALLPHKWIRRIITA